MSRISEQQMQKALEQEKTTSKADHAKIKAIAGMVESPRSFIFKTPDEYGMTGWHDPPIRLTTAPRSKHGSSLPVR